MLALFACSALAFAPTTPLARPAVGRASGATMQLTKKVRDAPWLSPHTLGIRWREARGNGGWMHR